MSLSVCGDGWFNPCTLITQCASLSQRQRPISLTLGQVRLPGLPPYRLHNTILEVHGKSLIHENLGSIHKPIEKQTNLIENLNCNALPAMALFIYCFASYLFSLNFCPVEFHYFSLYLSVERYLHLKWVRVRKIYEKKL